MKRRLEFTGIYLIVLLASLYSGGTKNGFYFLLGWFVADLFFDLWDEYERTMEKD